MICQINQVLKTYQSHLILYPDPPPLFHDPIMDIVLKYYFSFDHYIFQKHGNPHISFIPCMINVAPIKRFVVSYIARLFAILK